jgi:hypothetical protein
MSIATEKVKFASERFILVRMNPARALTFAVYSGTVYSASMPYIVNRVERNGAVLTKVSTIPTNNDEWYYDATAQVLYVKTASAPSTTTNGNNQVICFYYLFYTNTKFRSLPEDPEDSLTSTRLWEPRILATPSITQSITNILSGYFTISNASINLINEDGNFQEYLTTQDSFFNKQVDIWLCINSAANIQKIFTGTIRGLNITSNTVNLNCVDSFNKLDQPALMGDTNNEAYFSRNALSFPDLDPSANDLPCPYIVGSSSRFKTVSLSVALSGVPDVYRLDIGTNAYCVDFDSAPSTSTNRTWGCCRIKGSVQTQSFGAVQATLDSGTGYRFIRFASTSNVFIGDTIKWVESAVTYYGIVNYVGTFTYSSVSYNVIISDPTGPFTLASTVSNLKSFATFITLGDGTRYYPKYERDYTTTETTTTGGNKYIEIEFVNNFEANLSMVDPLDPQQDEVFFRTSNTVIQSHADIIKDMLEINGFVVNSASFSSAYTDLPVKARFHIPNFDESDYKSFLEYTQDVLSSAISYLKINSSFEVEYHIFSSPSSSNTRDDALILNRSISVDIEYGDIETSIIAYNPHHDSQIAIDAATSPSATASSNLSKYLHGVSNVTRFRHVLEEFTSNIQRHIDLRSERRAIYRFETATEDIDSEIGDDVLLDDKRVLGTSDQSAVKITSITKSPNRISLEASDLFRL